MRSNLITKARHLAIALLILAPLHLSADTHWYGGQDDREFATELWGILLEARLTGDNAIPDKPYEGTHPHGAILESVIATVTINNVDTMVVVKRSYRGKNVSISAVSSNRARFLNDITVMLKREPGYDEENQNWFWVKYNPDGSIAATPNGIKLAGRIAKGKRKGCIACHRKAMGNDYLFVQ